MTVQNIIRNLREKHGLSQDQLAGRVMVTRQAVSRWETGETQPNTDTLKLLSKEADLPVLRHAPVGRRDDQQRGGRQL